jgi:peroxiredoxin
MCNQQLADFEKHMDEVRAKDIAVIAASADSLQDTRGSVKKLNLTLRVGYGLKAKEISAKTGTFYDEKGNYLHAAGFVLNPEGRVANAVYSTMAIGRLVAADCLDLIGYIKKSS